MKVIASTLALVFVFFADDVQAQNLIGQWSGVAQTGSEETQLALTIGHVNDGLSASMTLPDIGVSGWPAQSFSGSSMP